MGGQGVSGGYERARADLMAVGGVKDACEAEVGQFEQQGRGVNQQIRRLHVAMQNIRRMNVLEGAQQLIEEQADVLFRQPPSARHQLLQVSSHQLL